MRLTRRHCLACGLQAGLSWAALLPLHARAGAQREETLSDAVRTALSAALAQQSPPEPSFASVAEQARYQQWHATMARRLARFVDHGRTRQDLLQTVWYESHRAGLPVSLVLGVIEVESGFRKFAVSRADARGYMQVMPFWLRNLGQGDAAQLFHLQTNIRFGCVILRHYLQREDGNLFLALGRYNGSRGQAAYPSAVLAARRRWHFPPLDQSAVPLPGP
jgi:soluble lytic murein transglycosylase-like protein